MKKLSVLVFAVTLFSVLLAACGGGSGPKDVVEDWIKAMEERDSEKVNQTLCSNADWDLKQTADTFRTFLEIKFAGLKYEELSKSSDAATIRVTGTLRMVRIMAGEQEQPLDANFQLAREDGKWCLVLITDN